MNKINISGIYKNVKCTNIEINEISQYEIKSLHYCGIIRFVQYLPGNIRIKLIQILTKGKERFLQHIKCK